MTHSGDSVNNTHQEVSSVPHSSLCPSFCKRTLKVSVHFIMVILQSILGDGKQVTQGISGPSAAWDLIPGHIQQGLQLQDIGQACHWSQFLPPPLPYRRDILQGGLSISLERAVCHTPSSGTRWIRRFGWCPGGAWSIPLPPGDLLHAKLSHWLHWADVPVLVGQEWGRENCHQTGGCSPRRPHSREQFAWCRASSSRARVDSLLSGTRWRIGAKGKEIPVNNVTTKERKKK